MAVNQLWGAVTNPLLSSLRGRCSAHLWDVELVDGHKWWNISALKTLPATERGWSMGSHRLKHIGVVDAQFQEGGMGPHVARCVEPQAITPDTAVGEYTWSTSGLPKSACGEDNVSQWFSSPPRNQRRNLPFSAAGCTEDHRIIES